MFLSVLQPGALSGSMDLTKLGSVLMSVAVSTEKHSDTCGLGHHLRPC